MKNIVSVPASIKSVTSSEAMNIVAEMEVLEKLDLEHSLVVKGISAIYGTVVVFFSAVGDSALMLL